MPWALLSTRSTSGPTAQRSSIAKLLLYEIAVSCPRIVPRIPPWTQPAVYFSTLRHRGPILDDSSGQFSTSGTTRPLDTRPALIVLGFELTDLSRIVLLQAIVPESCRSQASCQCGNA